MVGKDSGRCLYLELSKFDAKEILIFVRVCSHATLWWNSALLHLGYQVGGTCWREDLSCLDRHECFTTDHGLQLFRTEGPARMEGVRICLTTSLL